MSQLVPPTELTIATLNVLHALVPLSWPIIQPTRRYREIAKAMMQSPAQVYCLNEVTQFFLDVVQPSVHDKYPYSTHLVLAARKHAVKIYSGFPLEEIFVTDWLVIARVDINRQDSVVVAAAHLSHDQRQADKRSREIAQVRAHLETYKNDTTIPARTRLALQRNRVILLGDLNLHLRGETALLYRNGFWDCWPQAEVGYTWDPQVNPMINMVLPFDNRRMRLDRIAVSNGSDLQIDSIRITCNQKIENSWYLYPSDHFGLEAKFTLLQCSVTRHVSNQQMDQLQRDNVTGFRTIRRIGFMRLMTLAVLGLGVLLICL